MGFGEINKEQENILLRSSPVEWDTSAFAEFCEDECFPELLICQVILYRCYEGRIFLYGGSKYMNEFETWRRESIGGSLLEHRRAGEDPEEMTIWVMKDGIFYEEGMVEDTVEDNIGSFYKLVRIHGLIEDVKEKIVENIH